MSTSSSDSPPRRSYRYDCFISYAHEDRATIDWLERVLARTWVPGKRRRRVFVDRSQMAAGGLTDTLKRALADSRFLIVCCSPSALTSPWVNKEIDEFAHSRDERLHATPAILACLVGESTSALPHALRWVQRERGDELFLPDLTGAPLLWSRQRRHQVKREALSLLAPITGLPDREALLARRFKWWLAAAITAIIAAAGYAGWTWWLTTANGSFYRTRQALLASAAQEELVDRQMVLTAAAFGRLDDRIAVNQLSLFIEEKTFQAVLLASGYASLSHPECPKVLQWVNVLDAATVRTWPEASLLSVSRCHAPMPDALQSQPASVAFVRGLAWAGLGYRAATIARTVPADERLGAYAVLAASGVGIPQDFTAETTAWVQARDPFVRLSDSLDLLVDLDLAGRLDISLAVELLRIASESVRDTDVGFANTWTHYQRLAAQLAGAGRTDHARAVLNTYPPPQRPCPVNGFADGLAWRGLALIRTGLNGDAELTAAAACAAAPIPATRTWAEWRTIAVVYALSERWREAFGAAERPEDERVRVVNRAYMVELWERLRRARRRPM